MPGGTAKSLHGQRASARRWHRPVDEIEQLDRDYAAAKIADFIEKTVGKYPPLTDEQRDSIAKLLRGGDQVA